MATAVPTAKPVEAFQCMELEEECMESTEGGSCLAPSLSDDMEADAEPANGGVVVEPQRDAAPLLPAGHLAANARPGSLLSRLRARGEGVLACLADGPSLPSPAGGSGVAGLLPPRPCCSPAQALDLLLPDARCEAAVAHEVLTPAAGGTIRLSPATLQASLSEAVKAGESWEPVKVSLPLSLTRPASVPLDPQLPAKKMPCFSELCASNQGPNAFDPYMPLKKRVPGTLLGSSQRVPEAVKPVLAYVAAR